MNKETHLGKIKTTSNKNNEIEIDFLKKISIVWTTGINTVFIVFFAS